MTEEPETLTDYQLGLVEATLYARRITSTPTLQEFADALATLQQYLRLRDPGHH